MLKENAIESNNNNKDATLPTVEQNIYYGKTCIIYLAAWV
jgi:hypothetical protein